MVYGHFDSGPPTSVKDLDVHLARAKEAGAEIVRPLTATSYGSREYRARDLEGHLSSFGTYQPSE